MEKLTSSTDHGHLCLVNGSEVAFLSLSMGENETRLWESLPLLHDKVIAAAADAAISYSVKHKKQVAATGFLGDIVKGFKKESTNRNDTSVLGNFTSRKNNMLNLNRRECPPELREAITSIIFAAPRCSDLPDLLQVKNLFAAKYGKEFVSAVSELRPDTSVNRTIIEKLSVSAPAGQEKLRLLKEIAREYNVVWDSYKTEAEFNKKHDDLLDGPKQRVLPSTVPVRLSDTRARSPNKPKTQSSPSSRASNDMPSRNVKGTRASYTSNSVDSSPSNRQNSQKDAGLQPSDILVKARAAIASAERASAAARAASELGNVKLG